MTWLKLTDLKGEPIVINMDHVHTMYPAVTTDPPECTKLNYADGGPVIVRESLDEIMGMKANRCVLCGHSAL